MKNSFLILVFLVSITISSSAQKGVNQIGVGAEIGFPTGEFGESCKTGFGGSIKFLNGVGKANQITFSAGYTSFSVKGSGSQASASIGILPLLLGYRHNVAGGLHIEPQAGYASYHVRVSSNGQSASDSKGAFTYAIGLAYVVSDVDFGVRFQNGSIEGSDFTNFAIRIGYNFALKSKK